MVSVSSTSTALCMVGVYSNSPALGMMSISSISSALAMVSVSSTSSALRNGHGNSFFYFSQNKNTNTDRTTEEFIVQRNLKN